MMSNLLTTSTAKTFINDSRLTWNIPCSIKIYVHIYFTHLPSRFFSLHGIVPEHYRCVDSTFVCVWGGWESNNALEIKSKVGQLSAEC